ncbi:MAG: DUF2071 domain-containing protein [Sandaracinus sp.]
MDSRPVTHAATELARPRMRLFDVSSDLVDFAITTFDVSPEALAAKLPPGITPERVTLPDGRERALVSAVSFVNTRFFVGYAPFVKLRCAQTNYRAYVRLRDGTSGCFFFATHLDHFLVFMPRHLWRMPWSRSHVKADVRWDGERLERYDWRGEGGEGGERLRVRGTGTPLGTLPGFASDADTQRLLTAPLLGWLVRRGGSTVAHYSVWHAPLALERCEVEEARFECWERLGLVEPGQAPHSVLAQRLTKYLILLPPHAVTLP